MKNRRSLYGLKIAFPFLHEGCACGKFTQCNELQASRPDFSHSSALITERAYYGALLRRAPGSAQMVGGLVGAARPTRAGGGHRILVAIVSNSAQDARDRVLAGMRHIDATFSSHRARVDWAITAYDDGAEQWQAEREAASALRHVRLVAVLNASADADQPLSSGERRAKGAHRRRAVQAAWRLHGEEHWTDVWLSDGDIAFEGFELGAFLARRACAHAGGAPLIVQPTLLQSTQCWPYNHNTYNRSAGTTGWTRRPCMRVLTTAPSPLRTTARPSLPDGPEGLACKGSSRRPPLCMQVQPLGRGRVALGGGARARASVALGGVGAHPIAARALGRAAIRPLRRRLPLVVLLGRGGAHHTRAAAVASCERSARRPKRSARRPSARDASALTTTLPSMTGQLGYRCALVRRGA